MADLRVHDCGCIDDHKEACLYPNGRATFTRAQLDAAVRAAVHKAAHAEIQSIRQLVMRFFKDHGLDTAWMFKLDDALMNRLAHAGQQEKSNG